MYDCGKIYDVKDELFKIKDKRIKVFNKRLGRTQIIFALFALCLICHLFCIQILDIKHYRAKAKRQRTSSSFIMRGDIYDRNGIKLATDMVYYDVYARPKDFDDKIHTKEELAKALAPILKMQPTTIMAKFEAEKNQTVILLKKNVGKAERDAIAKLCLREIPVDKKSTRVYPQGCLASHVLGYYNMDADVSAGVEYTAKDKLEHVTQRPNIEKTPSGNLIYTFSTDPVAATEPLKGEDVTLTIDTAIQHISERELDLAVSKFKAQRGAVIVMNPKNGEILAYAVYPSYDPNHYRTASMLQTKNWTLTDIFPPGSTFKTITVASSLALGKINEHTKINDTGKIKIGWWTISNYDYKQRGAPGLIDLVYFFQHSSNVGAVKIAQTMSSTEFHDILEKFGFGHKTGIDLPGESIGLLKPASKWDVSDHACMGYGYGSSVTAIQMVSAVSALANNGVRVTPHVIKYTPVEAETKIKSVQVMTPETAKVVTKLLTKSIEAGNSPIKMDDYYIAAKTGTSHKPKENDSGYTNKLYTSIVGYLPATDPQVLIYVVVDSAQGGEIWGSTVAAPIFKAIASQVASIMNLTPDKHNARTAKEKMQNETVKTN